MATQSKSELRRASHRLAEAVIRIRSISGSDFLQLLAVTISGTLIVAFLIFNVFTDPIFAKIAVVGISFAMFLVGYWEFKIGPRLTAAQDGSTADNGIPAREKSYEDNAELAKRLRTHEKILKNLFTNGAQALEGVEMQTHYSPALVRVFAVGASAATIGLILTIVGAIAGNFPSQYAGAGLLAIGLLIVTFTVLRAQQLDEQHSR